MTLFIALSTLMALSAALIIALPLMRGLRGQHVSAPAQDAANVAIYTDQQAELDTDLINGLLSQAQFDLAKHELERRLLQDARPTAESAASITTVRWPAIVTALMVPLLALGLYLKIGNLSALDPAALNPPAADPMISQLHQVEALLPKLEQRLQAQPNDPTGWDMLGKSYMALERYPEAAKAYAMLAELQPREAQVFADYADAQAMAQGQTLAGKPTELIAQALKLDPTNGKALYLAGFAAQEAGNPKLAIAHWEKLIAQLPPDSEGATVLRQNLAELKQKIGSPASGQASASVSGQVRLAAILKDKPSPQDTLFVFARAVEGPKMPLAMLRVQVKDLPLNFKLDDSMAMSPQMKLSNFPEVVIVARISKSGGAVPQPGDLEGMSAPVKLGAKNIAVEISRKVE
ncbi:MAG: c-type cytochrome biogenesis protein CcmI [Burkholderiales bacterium]|nr:c-type cytochrome biogenesis protein CcmI [Burkholderiales bacterium]